jgi:hypothetical protein
MGLHCDTSGLSCDVFGLSYVTWSEARAMPRCGLSYHKICTVDGSVVSVVLVGEEQAHHSFDFHRVEMRIVLIKQRARVV